MTININAAAIAAAAAALKAQQNEAQPKSSTTRIKSSGIGRAAFHWTSIRYIDNSDYGKGYVEFDNRSMFA